MIASKPTWGLTLGQAFGAGAVFCIALGVATGVGLGGAELMGWPRTVGSLIQAALCTSITVAGVGLIARSTNTKAKWVGLHRDRIVRDLVAGFGVIAAAALLVLGPVAVLGGIRFDGIDPGPLFSYLGLTVVVATGLEAFPEEFAFRGMAFSSLRERLRPIVAATAATVLFVFAPGLSMVVTAVVTRILGVGHRPWYALAPDGQEPISYLVLLTLWSICLIQARQVTGSIWVGVGAHLLLLLINRTLLGSATGSGVQLSDPDLILIIPLYVVVAAIGFRLIRGRLG